MITNVHKPIMIKEISSFLNNDNLKKPEAHKSVDHAYHLYPLQIDFEKLPLTKVEFFEKMKELGINLQVHYIPIHLQPFYKKNYGFEIGDFPVSESFYRCELSLPIYPGLSKESVDLVINKILIV